ncbi:MAG: caspase family protein [Bacteroidota bacterium]
MRTLFRFLLCLGLFALIQHSPVSAQTFFETTFTSKSITYTGLLIYYDDNDMTMRVKYTRGAKGYTVSEFHLKGETFTFKDGRQGLLLDGQEGKRVYPDVEPGFMAFNFVQVYNRQGEREGVYFLSDREFNHVGLSLADMHEVYEWKEVDPTETFTPEYVFNFYDKEEELYNVLLSLNPSNHLGGSGTTASTTEQPNLPTDDKWSVIVSKGTGFGEEIIKNDHQWPEAWVKQKTEQGYRITKATYGAQNYVVVMAKRTGMDRQVHRSSANWPADWINQQRSRGLQISEVVHGNGKWSVVMSSGTGFSAQKVFQTAHFPLREVSQNKVKGYYITSMTYSGDTWGVVMSQGPDYPSQIWKVEDEFPGAWIESKWSQGYAVTDIMYGDNEWVAIMSKGTPYTQEFLAESAFPREYLEGQWDLGYRVTDFVYSGDGGMYSASLEPSPTPVNYEGDPTLHLIMVANTRVSDIGASCTNDKEKVVRELENISEAIGIPVKQHLIIDDNYGKSQVISTINDLKTGPNDIILFIYTGHGFRFEDQDSEYPMIDLTYSQYQRVEENTSMSLEEIHQRLIRKGARLTMVLGDCCNSSIGRTSRSGAASLASRTNERSRLDRLRKLFMETQGNILAAAAKPNETACGNAQTGGYFINSFFGALHKETSYLYEEEPSWRAVLDRTMESATYKTDRLSGCTPQHGIYKMK